LLSKDKKIDITFKENDEQLVKEIEYIQFHYDQQMTQYKIQIEESTNELKVTEEKLRKAEKERNKLLLLKISNVTTVDEEETDYIIIQKQLQQSQNEKNDLQNDVKNLKLMIDELNEQIVVQKNR